MPQLRIEDRYPTTCQEMPDGSLMVTGTLACKGVMRYACLGCVGASCDACGGKGYVLEAVDDEALSDPEWLRTIGTAPVTLEHPPYEEGAGKLLNIDRVARYSAPDYDGPGKIPAGTSMRVWFDEAEHATRCEIRTFDPDVQAGIRGGLFDLSPGYLPTYGAGGTIDGQQVDRKQVARLGNHVSLILAKPFGGLGGREPRARFDSQAGESTMTPEEVKAMIQEAIAAYAAADKEQDKASDSEAVKSLSPVISALEEKVAKLEAMLAVPAPAAAPEAGEGVEADAASKPEAEQKPIESAEPKEEEVKADAADEINVRGLAARRGLDLSQPVAALRAAILSGTGYEKSRRALQRVFVSTQAEILAKTDAADPMRPVDAYWRGMAPSAPVVQPEQYLDFTQRREMARLQAKQAK